MTAGIQTKNFGQKIFSIQTHSV